MAGKKHKQGPNARARDIKKGAKQGPKTLGVTKPPSNAKSYTGIASKNLGGKKAKKAAAREAAYAIIGGKEAAANKAAAGKYRVVRSG